MDVVPFGPGSGQGPPADEGLVVGMGENRKQVHRLTDCIAVPIREYYILCSVRAGDAPDAKLRKQPSHRFTREALR